MIYALLYLALIIAAGIAAHPPATRGDKMKAANRGIW